MVLVIAMALSNVQPVIALALRSLVSPALVLTVLLSCIFVNAAKAESLLQAKLAEVIGASKADEAKVEHLLTEATGLKLIAVKLKLISIYRKSGQPSKAESMLSGLLDNLPQYDNKMKIEVLISQAQLLRSGNNYAQAADVMLSKVLPLVPSNSPELGRIYQLTGVFFRLQMKLAKAKEYYILALTHFRAANDKSGEAKVYSNLGVLHESSGDLALAAEYQKKAMRFFERVNDVEELATNYFNLGELYYRSKDYQNALTFYERALSIDMKLNNMQDVGYDYHRIGTLYFQQKLFDNALVSTQQAIEIFSQESAFQVLSRSYIQQAKIHRAMGNSAAQFKSLQLAESAIIKAPSDHQLRIVWHSFGQYYLDHGDYLKAKVYADKSYVLADDLGLLTYQLSGSLLQADIYQKLKNFERANHFLLKSIDLRAQLTTEQHIKETERHKHDINLLQEQIKVNKLEEKQQQTEKEVVAQKSMNQRNLAIFIAVTVLFIVMFFLLYQRRKIALLKANLYEDALTQKNQLLADVSHELRTPLTALKLQVDALKYNLVENVDLSYQKLSEKVMDINRLITDVYELATSDINGLSFNAEPCDAIELINKWHTEFQQYVEPQGFQWRLKCHVPSAKVNIDQDRIKQVLSNLICNSVSYTEKPGTIQLSANIRKQSLVLIVKDTAPSVNEDELEQIFERLYRVEKSRSRQSGGSGLGLAISQRIIEAHHGEIFAKQSNIGGLAVIIKLPLL